MATNQIIRVIWSVWVLWYTLDFIGKYSLFGRCTYECLVTSATQTGSMRPRLFFFFPNMKRVPLSSLSAFIRDASFTSWHFHKTIPPFRFPIFSSPPPSPTPVRRCPLFLLHSSFPTLDQPCSDIAHHLYGMRHWYRLYICLAFQTQCLLGVFLKERNIHNDFCLSFTHFGTCDFHSVMLVWWFIKIWK